MLFNDSHVLNPLTFQAAPAPPESCDYDEVTEVSTTEASEGSQSLLQVPRPENTATPPPPQNPVSHWG